MKKGNVIKVALIAILALISTINVKAANTYVDASTCEGGQVYTNYYFFLDASEKMSTDYQTIGYYKNTVAIPKLQNIVDEYGIFSEEFAKVANRGYGVVPINTQSLDLDITVNGIGLRTFYQLFITGLPKTHGTDTYLSEHNWSKIENQIVKGQSNKNISFTSNDISKMINATILLKSYPSISPLLNLADGNYPVQIQITRKYSQGTLTNMANVTPLTILDGSKTWNAYLQPALFYVQYCTKTSTVWNNIEVLHYEPNAGADQVTNFPADQGFYKGSTTTISSVIPVRNGYTFLGWDVNPYSTVANPNLAAGKKVGSSMTLYAIWLKNGSTPVINNTETYSVVYRPNTTDTVSNMPAGITKNVGETMNISEIVPVRNGYTFIGWSSISGATSVEEKYKAGSVYKAGKDLILYAVWKKNSNTVLPDNPKTGIEEYAIPVSSIVAASFAGLKVLKKKKSYMQF